MSRRHILLLLSFVVLFLSLPLFGGTASAASTHTKSANVKPHRHVCDPTEYADTSLLSKNFVSNDIDHVISNQGPTTVTYTVTTSATTSAEMTVSSELSGKVDFLFQEAQAQLGVSLKVSYTVNAGTSTSVPIAPHTITHMQHGIQIDTLFVHDYWVDDTCLHNVDDTYGRVVAPQNDYWKIWTE